MFMQRPNRALIHALSEYEIRILMELARRIWQECYASILSSAQIEYMLEQRYNEPLLREQLRQKKTHWDVLYVNEQMVGFSHYFLTPVGSMKLDKLYLLDEARGQGFGRRFLARIEAKMRSLRVQHLELAVNRANGQAQAAYQQWGFIQSGALQIDIGGGFVMDDFLMTKKVTAVFQNPTREACCQLLKKAKTMAVIGLSPNPDRPSYGVAQAMQGFGFRIIPVHPTASVILGEKVYPDLASIPYPVDLVNVFRSAPFIDEAVDQTLAKGVKSLWIQEGIVNEAAATRALEAGVMVVMDRCIYRDYRDYCQAPDISPRPKAME